MILRGRGKMRGMALMLALAGSAVTLAGCQPAAEDTGNVLRRATSSEPRSLDPQMVMGNTTALINDMFEGLLSVDAAGEVRPGLAAHHEVSPDGLTYTFHLRDGLKWSDGKPITAEDVLFTYRRSVDPRVAARGGRALFRVVNFREVLSGKRPLEDLGVSAPDAKTIVIRIDKPAPYLPELIGSSSLVIVPKHVVEKYGAKWTAPGTIAVSGAYTLKEILPNTSVTLVKNPNYWDAGQVKIEQVVYYGIEKPATALTRFRAGELDIVFNVPQNQMAEIKSNYAKELHVESGIGTFYILLNNGKAPMNDARVREALTLATDRERIASTILQSEGEPAKGLVAHSMPGYKPLPLPYEGLSMAQRKERAIKLLAESGYGKQRPLSFVYKFGGVEINRQIAVALKSMWEEIGIKVTLENVGTTGVIRDAASGDYQAMRYNYYAPFSDPVAMLQLLQTGAVMNNSRYSNPRFDAALENADTTRDTAHRLAQLAEVEKIGMADYPVIPIYYPTRYYLIDQKVSGWVNNSNGEHPTRFITLKK